MPTESHYNSMFGFDVVKLEQPDQLHLLLVGQVKNLNKLLNNLNTSSKPKPIRLTIILTDEKMHNQMQLQEELLHYHCPIQVIPINNKECINKFIQIQKKMLNQSNTLYEFQKQIESQMALTREPQAIEELLITRFGWTRRRIAKMIEEEGINSFQKLMKYGNLSKYERQLLMKINRIAQM